MFLANELEEGHFLLYSSILFYKLLFLSCKDKAVSFIGILFLS